MSDLTRLIDEHEALIREFQDIRHEYPGEAAIERPFHSADRPPDGQTPTAAQEAAITWRKHCAAAMKRLRNHFICTGEEEKLKYFSFASCGQSDNFGYGYVAADLLRDLEEQTLLLAELREAPQAGIRSESLGATRALSPEAWYDNGWSIRLREARLANGHSQSKAADACDVPFGTFKKWEQGRTPAERNIPRLRQYIEASPSNKGVNPLSKIAKPGGTNPK